MTIIVSSAPAGTITVQPGDRTPASIIVRTMTGVTTTDVTEGVNLYFSNARAIAALSPGQDITLDANGRINSTASASSYSDSNVYSNVRLIGYATNTNVALKANVVDLKTANVAELTNLYFTNVRVYSNVVSIGYATNTNVALKANIVDLTTANVSELTNLYFTNTRVQSNVVTYLTGSADKTISGNVNITGNLNVSGNVTMFSANTIEISDTIIYLATGNSGDVQDIGFVGHITSPTYQHTGLVRDASDGTWKLFANVQTEPSSNILDFSTATYSSLQIGALAATTGSFSGNVAADSINVSGTINGVLGNISGLPAYATNAQLTSYATTTNVDLKANVVDLTTANVTEVNNQYFTNARATTAVTNSTLSNLTVSGDVVVSGNYSGNVAAATLSSNAASVGYIGMPQQSKSANYTTVIGDAGKHIYVTSTANVFIDSNANVAYPIGTAIAIIAGAGATVTISVLSDTMNLGGSGTVGNRTLAAYGMATAVKVASTNWFISGVGLT